MRVVALSRAARRELEAARDHLLETAGVVVALRFLDIIEDVQVLLSEFPKSGASWDFVGGGIRRWNMTGFP